MWGLRSHCWWFYIFIFSKVNCWWSARCWLQHCWTDTALHTDETKDGIYLWQFHKATKTQSFKFNSLWQRHDCKIRLPFPVLLSASYCVQQAPLFLVFNTVHTVHVLEIDLTSKMLSVIYCKCTQYQTSLNKNNVAWIQSLDFFNNWTRPNNLLISISEFLNKPYIFCSVQKQLLTYS